MLVLFVVLNLPPIQRYVAKEAALLLSEKIGSRVEVENASFSLFNEITLHKVSIEDLNSDTLLVIGELDAKFQPLLLLENKVIFRHVKLKNANAYLKNDTARGNNFDFIIKAFQSDKSESKHVFYQFKTIQLVDCRFSFDKTTTSKTGFDVNHLAFSCVNSKLSIHHIQDDSVSVSIENLSFTEKSGLIVNHLSANVNLNSQDLDIAGLHLQLPQTDVQLSDLHFRLLEFKNPQHFADSLHFEIGLKLSNICLEDFAALSPQLKGFSHIFTLSGNITGPVSQLSCLNLKLAYGNATRLSGSFRSKGLPDIQHAYIQARVSDFATIKPDAENLIANILKKPYRLPKALNALRQLHFAGELSGFLTKEINAVGHIKSNVGNITTDFSMSKLSDNKTYSYHGNVETQNFRLGEFLEDKRFGDVTFNLNLNGKKEGSQPPVFDIEGLVADFTYNDYEYKNIVLNGLYEENKFNGKIDIDDANGKVKIDGLLDFSQALPYYDFTAKVKKFRPAKMRLIDQYEDLELSLNLNTNFRGNNLDNLVGNVYMKDVFIRNGDNRLLLKKLEIISDVSDSLSSMLISSDFVNGVVEGKYTMSTIVTSIRYITSQYVPAALNTDKHKPFEKTTDNNFDFSLRISHLDTISLLLDLKWRTSKDIDVFGFYDDQSKKFRVRTLIPFLDYDRISLSDINIACENPQDAIKLAIDFKAERENNPAVFDVFFRANARNDSLSTVLQWSNNLSNVYAGELSFTTAFSRNEANKLLTVTDISPSEVVFSDTIWNIHQGTVTTAPEKIVVHNVKLENQLQELSIDGIMSETEGDDLQLNLQNLQFGILRQFVYMGDVNLDGAISGKVHASRTFGNPAIDADLGIKDFTFNDSRWGDLRLKAVWEDEQERLKADIVVADNEQPVVNLAGYVYPKQSFEVDLAGKVTGLKINFLQPIIESIMQDVEGMAYSDDFRMVGSIVKPLFEGKVFLKDAQFGINYLQTRYSFSDTLQLTRRSYTFNNIMLYDAEKHSGVVSGSIWHRAYKDFSYDINGHFTHILGLNTKKGDNENYYGKAYGTGNLRINGNSRNVTFDIGVKTEEGTHIVIPFSSSMRAADNNFITFIESRPPSTENAAETPGARRRSTARRRTESVGSAMKVNLQVEATPEAEVTLIIDPDAGDMMKVTGGGNLRMSYDESNGMRLYGSYMLNTGIYNFTLQNMLPKEFKIRNGSSIVWSGSPYSAEINIDASYSVKASLLDLLNEASLANITNTTTVTVNCLLNLTGELTQPTIRFNIEMPGNNSEVERMVKSEINSDEKMNRQIIFLLAMGRFYKSDELRNSQTGNNNELSSLVSSTLSSQLNYLLSQINDNVNVGVNYRSASEGEHTNTEIEMSVGAEMFNNKLVINGNIGYRNDVLATNNFIGDFDLEYKLNKSGRLRTKAYSHSNDKYYLRNTTTQGVGFIYREEFDTFGSLFDSYWKALFRKKEEE